MVTGELKSKIDGLWEIFWTGGLTNPLDVIEQMTYLMFIHNLDDSDNLRAKEAAMLGLPYESIFAKEVMIGDRTVDGSALKWSVFHDFPAGKMYSTVSEWVFPRHIIRMMVDLMEPGADEVVCENCTTSLIRVAAA